MEPIQIQNSRPALSLLVVEDDKTAIEVIRVIIPLKFPKITFHVAGDGNMGLALFKEYSPDIVVTDINLPGMDGIQMAEQIKAMKSDTRFIVLTGYSDKIRMDKFNEIGVCNYISKPLDLKKLFTAIEKCIEEITLERP